MEEQTKQYKCPSCASPLRYDVSGVLVCDTCGNKYGVFNFDNKKIGTDENKTGTENKEEKNQGFDWGDYKKNFEINAKRLNDRKVYICRSCGAEIETDLTTAATHCPYCDNEVVISDQLSGSLCPNLVIPFKLDKNAAEEAVRRHFKKKPLLPSDFKDKHKLEKLRGIYVPFWLFDSGVDGKYRFKCTKVRRYSDRDYNYTETKYYNVNISGKMQFNMIPVDGSEKMDDDLMDALEPFDYSDIIDFNEAYLTGFLADRFDEDPDKSLPRASSRMESCTEGVLRSQASSGYSSITKQSGTVELIDPGVKYALLPVYLLNLKYNNKNYRFAVNGQTGKTVGELPIGKLKKFLHTWVFGSGVAAVFTFLFYLIFR